MPLTVNAFDRWAAVRMSLGRVVALGLGEDVAEPVTPAEGAGEVDGVADGVETARAEADGGAPAGADSVVGAAAQPANAITVATAVRRRAVTDRAGTPSR